MINKQRVRRIKSGIYTFIVLMFFVPFIIMIVLSVRMIGLMKLVSDRLGAIPASAAVVMEIDAAQEEQPMSSGEAGEPDPSLSTDEAADVLANQQQDDKPEHSEEALLGRPEGAEDEPEAEPVSGQAGEASLLKNANHPDTGGKANRMML